MGFSFWLAVPFLIASGWFFVSAAKQVPDFGKSGLLGDLSVSLIWMYTPSANDTVRGFQSWKLLPNQKYNKEMVSIISHCQLCCGHRFDDSCECSCFIRIKTLEIV